LIVASNDRMRAIGRTDHSRCRQQRQRLLESTALCCATMCAVVKFFIKRWMSSHFSK